MLAVALIGVTLAGAGYVNAQQNSREQCRALLSGYFLDIHEEVRQQEAMETLLSRKLVGLSRAIKRQNDEFKQLRDRKKPGVFDADLEQAIMAAEDRLQQLQTESRESEANRQRSQSALTQAREHQVRMEKALKPVFHIKVVKNDDLGYGTYEVTYRTACPKYRTLCPLPSQERQALAVVLPEQDLPEPCRRYSQIRD